MKSSIPHLLAQVQPVSEAEITEQTNAFAALRARLGPPAADEEVKAFLATREPAPPDPDLNPKAAAHFQQRLGI